MLTVAPPRATATTSSKVTGPTPTTTLDSFMTIRAAFIRWGAADDDAVDDRHSRPIGQVYVGGRLQHDEVGAHAGCKDTDVVAAQRCRSARGGRPHGLRRG